ncbi:hypothetical protein ACFYUV_11365 [Nonomuraea sp. NPDC003560]|uniref:hypothetical protein n=1 Tax=Nonomuraea sp. NPDC003560 TaxID=3364341 RepID=UPI0036ADDAB9
MSTEPPYTVADGIALPTPAGLALLCGVEPDQLQAELHRLATNPNDEFPDIWIRRAANTLTRALQSHGAAGLIPATLDQLAALQASEQTRPL